MVGMIEFGVRTNSEPTVAAARAQASSPRFKRSSPSPAEAISAQCEHLLQVRYQVTGNVPAVRITQSCTRQRLDISHG